MTRAALRLIDLLGVLLAVAFLALGSLVLVIGMLLYAAGSCAIVAAYRMTSRERVGESVLGGGNG